MGNFIVNVQIKLTFRVHMHASTYALINQTLYINVRYSRTNTVLEVLNTPL